MFNKIKLESNQYNIVKKLSVRTGRKESDIVWDLIEIGVITLITAKDSQEKDEAILQTIQGLRNAVLKDEDFRKFSDILSEAFNKNLKQQKK